MAKLVVIEGKLAGRTYEVSGPLVIGRGEGVSIRTPDNKVSREHTKIFPQGGEFHVVDLNSRNGTLVNDAPVTRRVLRHGDEILIGATRLRFENPVAAKPPAPAPAKKEPAFREVVDLRSAPPSAPAGSVDVGDIVVKDRALQYSKYRTGKKKASPLNDDLGQRNLGYQLLMGLVVLLISIAFLIAGLYVGGVIGQK